MAKASWLKVSKSSGSGDSSVSISADFNSGRNERSTDITVGGTGVTSKTFTVKQAGSGLLLTHDYTSNKIDVSKSGSTQTITFSTNAASLKVKGKSIAQNGTTSDGSILSSGASEIPLTGYFYQNNLYYGTLNSETPGIAKINTLKGNSTAVDSSGNVSGDPGATTSFNGTFSLTVPKNTGTAPVRYMFEIVGYTATNGGGTSDNSVITIEVGVGDSFVKVLKNGSEVSSGSTILTLVAEGTAQTINIDSNTAWTIS